MRAVLVAMLSLAGACASDPVDVDEPVNCAKQTADEFTVGLERLGTVHDVKLMSVLPAPPASGDNEFIIHIDSVAGAAPVTGAAIVATPFMSKPQAHGTPVKVKIEALPSAGDYKLSPVNMWMPGVWETTIEMTSPAGSDSVAYRFCIPS
jgi:hypothetical protein